MATITLNLAGFAYSWTIAAGDVQKVLDAYTATMPGATSQDVADMIAQGFVDNLVHFTAEIEREELVAAARASVTPIAVTPN